LTRYANEHLRDEYGALFRFDEYAGMNLLRYVYEYLHGGWGIEGNTAPRCERIEVST
jgi:hypothetical protein